MKDYKIQMRFSDIDGFGHVNNVNMQHYYDLGKCDYFDRVLHVCISKEQQIAIILANTNANYLKETRLGENIWVRTRVSRIGNKSITIEQEIYNKDTGEIKSNNTSVQAVFDFLKRESIPVPEEWRKMIEEEEKTE